MCVTDVAVCVRGVCLRLSMLSLIARALRGQFLQNPGSTEACEPGLARGACFVAHRLEVDAVAGLL